MMRASSVPTWYFTKWHAVGVLSLLLSPVTSAQEVSPGPLAPEEALQKFQVAPGLKIELVASEPTIVDPVAIRFAEDGRMWVVEMRDYPHGPSEGQAPQSRIKVLEDRDRDGLYESATVFADKLLFVTGLQPWKGGAIVTLSGQVAYLKDTDGDGKADQHDVWYRGFAEQNSQLRANHPRLGLDHQVYIANGLRGGTVVDARRDNATKIALAGKDFRFDPMTFEYEALSGVGQFGLCFDDFGNRFVCSNRNPLRHIVLEDRQLRMNPRFAVPAVIHDAARFGADSRVYSLSRAWTTSNLHAGQFTAACGVLLYRGDALSPEFYGNSFTCDPTGNLVHREILRPQGVTFQGQPARDGVEFLASPDEWFRPVNLGLGPDGGLYVVDMYRAVIEHPQFMPEELKQRPDLLLGKDRGRIYRIVHPEHRTKAPEVSVAQHGTNQLVELLGHSNAWQRDTAARLLYERQDAAAVPPLRVLLQSGKSTASRVLALWALRGLDALTDADLKLALADKAGAVRRQAVRLCADQADRSDELTKLLYERADDPEATVLFEVALALGPAKDPQQVTALRAIGESAELDSWLVSALAIASGTKPGELLFQLLSKPDWQRSLAQDAGANRRNLVETLATLAARVDDANTKLALRAMLTVPQSADYLSVHRAVLLSSSRALASRRSSLKAIATEEAFAKYLDAILTGAKQDAVDRQRSPAVRGQALDLLARTGEQREVIHEIALEESDLAVRSKAIGLMSSGGDDAYWQQQFARFRSESPPVRRALLNAALSSKTGVANLLSALREEHVRPAELDRTQANRLLKVRDAEQRKAAAQLLADAIPADRKEVLREYQAALALPSDAERGKPIFAKNCATCHRIGTLGTDVAPDISDSRTRKPEQLLTDIIQPNRAIDSNYVSYNLLTADGRSLSGIISNETANSITLRQPEGKTITILRSDLDEMRSTGVSLMPDGLEKTISMQAMADLIAFIKNWRYLDGLTPLGPVND